MSQDKTTPFKERCMECLSAYWSRNQVAEKQGYYCLFAEIAPFVHARFKNLLPDQRADVIQVTLLQIHKSGADTFIEYCSAWVRRIAHNEGVNMLRREEKHSKGRATEEQLDFDPGVTSFKDDFSKGLQRDQAVEHMSQFLSEESGGEHDQDIINGLINGESYEEIGQRIGRSKGAVATRASVIRKKLRPLWDEHN